MIMAAENKSISTRVCERFKSCFTRRSFTAPKLRGSIMDTTMAVSTTEVTIFLILSQYSASGVIPAYVPELLILGIAVMEVLVAPFIVKLLSWRPQQLLVSWHVVLAVCFIPFLAIKVSRLETTAGSDLCGAQNGSLPVVTTTTVLMLVTCVVLGIWCSITRMSVWSYSLAYLDKLEPSKMTLNLSILVMSRILPLLLIQYLFRAVVRNWLWLQAVGLIFSVLCRVLQLRLNLFDQHEILNETSVQRQDRGRIRRVLTDCVLMSHMLSLGLVTAGLYGYMYYQQDFVKAKYHIAKEQYSNNYMVYLWYTLHFVVFVVVVYGYKQSEPFVSKFSLKRAVRRAGLLSAAAGVVYVATVLVHCDKVTMVGLSEGRYIQPACSLQCGCGFPWDELAPVCDVTTMTTYFSPCHAGCITNHTISGIRVFSECSCSAPSSRVILDACNEPHCRWILQLHQILTVMVITLTILALTTQAMVILRAAAPRDRPAALGVLLATVALFVFVTANLVYYFVISGKNCAWYEGGKCQLHNNQFPVAVGSTSAGLAFLSALISSVCFFMLRRCKERRDRENSNPEQFSMQ